MVPAAARSASGQEGRERQPRHVETDPRRCPSL